MTGRQDPAAELAAVREAAMWIVETSAFYRDKLARAGIDVAAVQSWEDFRRIPPTRKSEVPAAQQAAPPFGPLLAVAADEVASVAVSPGPLYIPRTSGEPTGIEALHESLDHMGVRAGDVAHVTLSYHIMPGGLRLHRAFETFGCRVINGGIGNTELQARVASDLGATVYAGTPTFLGKLAEAAEQQGRRLRYRVGFSTAEALTPSVRRSLEERLGIELFDHCGEALIGPLAGECREHDGMHLHSREMHVEMIDPGSGRPAAPGDSGELVVTQLGVRAMPLLRYAPGDLFRLHADPCPCGDPAPRVFFAGQVGGVRKIKGVLVHTAQVAEALGDFSEIGRFQVAIHSAADGSDRPVLRAHCTAAAAPEITARIAERIRAATLIQMAVELVDDSSGLDNEIVDRRAK